ncbi:hypothetical protein BDV30DRAFT_205745 [Aspergillus minisclerotigenes]|uniref:Uncharacterized protein n=1 Tax=Aspergillus minisclerotigenes TaxID=656917 RepID=A0A5N6JGV1_9EURO|nr:hypothetical protein BDV30DRAFT_205745 [Aspergillus minisclerotigenes]
MALEQAGRRKLKSKRRQSVRKSVRQAGTCKLPVEILDMIANYLPSQAKANMEKAWVLVSVTPSGILGSLPRSFMRSKMLRMRTLIGSVYA